MKPVLGEPIHDERHAALKQQRPDLVLERREVDPSIDAPPAILRVARSFRDAGSPVASAQRWLPARVATPCGRQPVERDLGRSRRIARQMAYCLRLVDVVVVGKRRHAIEYRVA